ncbi:hypothetical protein EKH55_4791 [Sinorhizobium alkalisoli]|nr:hypothetical protein EKH55_4791 [Sinorhizobium alkalisoli]
MRPGSVSRMKSSRIAAAEVTVDGGLTMGNTDTPFEDGGCLL